MCRESKLLTQLHGLGTPWLAEAAPPPPLPAGSSWISAVLRVVPGVQSHETVESPTFGDINGPYGLDNRATMLSED